MKRIKNIYLLLFGLTIFLAGCSSTYTLKDFPSKQKFYEDFNNFAKNKNVKVTLKNDSSFTTSSGALISNDTLFQVIGIQKKELKLKRDKIKGIENDNIKKYKHPVYKITLKDGKELKATEIKMLPSSFLEFSVLQNNYGNFIPIKTINKISYKDNWLGILPGVLIGTVAGFVGGQLAFLFMHNGTQFGDDKASGYGLAVLSLGPIAGIVLGWITGYNYIYKFNP